MTTKRSDRETADLVAQSQGYENHDAYVESIMPKIDSKNPMIKQKALENVSSYAQGLVMLLLQQVIEDTISLDEEMAFANQFDDGWVKEGNSRQYIKTIVTGHTNYDNLKNNFVPATKTNGKSESHVISMYDRDAQGNVTLRPYTEQFAKEYTIDNVNLIPYFKSGALMEYISRIREDLKSTWELKKYHKVAEFIATESAKFKKQIAGQGDDMYDSMIEFLSHIENIQRINKKYMLGDTEAIGKTKVSDLVIIMTPSNKSKLQSGILTQLFNAKLLNNKGIIDADNITLLSEKVQFNGATDAVTILEDEHYVDDDTIIVFDKKAIKFIYQLNQTGTQDYSTNMTTQITTHIWYTMGILPWYQGFVYKNKNLSKLPAKP